MRLLQDVSVLEGVDTGIELGNPGDWTVLTPDFSIQILNLKDAPSEDVSLYQEQGFEPLNSNEAGVGAVPAPNTKILGSATKLTKGNLEDILKTEYMWKTYLNLESAFEERSAFQKAGLLNKSYVSQPCASDATNPVRVGNETLNNQGLSGKAWSSDSCLSYSTVDDKVKYKQFSSMCDLSGGVNQNTFVVESGTAMQRPIQQQTRLTPNTNNDVKSILSTKKKREGKEVKKTVSFKKREAETRYFVKCEFDGHDERNEMSTDAEHDGYSNLVSDRFEHSAQYSDNKQPISADDSDALLMVKPLLPICQTKVAKIVKCKTNRVSNVKRTDKQTPCLRKRIVSASKRIFTHENKNTIEIPSRMEHVNDSVIDSELVSKIHDIQSQRKQNRHSDLGSLSQFLMEHNGENSMNDSRYSPDLFTDRTLEAVKLKSNNEVNSDEFEGFMFDQKRTCRIGTSNLKTVSCQRKLTYNATLNEATFLDINNDTKDDNEQSRVNVDAMNNHIQNPNKSMRPRLGVHTKVPKMLELDDLDISLVCDLKNKIAKTNKQRIKTNGTLRISQGIKRHASPMGRCYSSPITKRGLHGVSRLESYV